MDEIFTAMNEAIATHNWPVVGAAALAIVVPLVLKALGKEVPFVEPAVKAIFGAIKGIFVKKPAEPSAPPAGLANVVKIEEVKDDSSKKN